MFFFSYNDQRNALIVDTEQELIERFGVGEGGYLKQNHVGTLPEEEFEELVTEYGVINSLSIYSLSILADRWKVGKWIYFFHPT